MSCSQREDVSEQTWMHAALLAQARQKTLDKPDVALGTFHVPSGFQFSIAEISHVAIEGASVMEGSGFLPHFRKHEPASSRIRTYVRTYFVASLAGH